ncbi:MAG: hypothetical protein JOZ39_12980 [Chloroflexi bacterium]|nr:hypothetical protein [Chloroflexota bacterium]
MSGNAGSGQMTYHGGPTERSGSTNYAIFWQPGGSYMSPSYESLITRFFSDLGSSGLYNIASQYTDTSGNIVNSSSFGGSWVDTSAYPANPLSDAQIQNEVLNALSHNPSWPSNSTNAEFFVFTGKNEGSCSGSACAFTAFCAYHSGFQEGNGNIHLYSNMPYAGTDLAGCGISPGVSNPTPNGDIDADSEINATSHELMESVTDPLGTGWFFNDGAHEIGDQCAYVFGSAPGGANQHLNGHAYIMQLEWSNRASGCVGNYADFSIAGAPPSVTVSSGSTASYTLTLKSKPEANGYSLPTTLAVTSALPTGATASFTTNPVTPSAAGTSTSLNISTTASTPQGTYTVTIQGTSSDDAATTEQASVILVVGAVTPTSTPISSSPTPTRTPLGATSTPTRTPINPTSTSTASGGTPTHVPSTPTPVSTAVGSTDRIPPFTQVSRTDVSAAGGHFSVVLSLNVTDNQGGSGVSKVTYWASGAQTIAPTTHAGSSASVTISTPGTTVFFYQATDVAGNVEPVRSTTIVDR